MIKLGQITFFVTSTFHGKYFLVWLWAALLAESLAYASSFTTARDIMVLW